MKKLIAFLVFMVVAVPAFANQREDMAGELLRRIENSPNKNSAFLEVLDSVSNGGQMRPEYLETLDIAAKTPQSSVSQNIGSAIQTLGSVSQPNHSHYTYKDPQGGIVGTVTQD